MATGPLSARLRQLRYMVGLLRYDEPQTLTSAQRDQARANIGAADASTAALAARKINAGTGLTGGGDMTRDRTINADLATQAEAEAGTSNVKLMTPLGVAQAIAARAPSSGFTWSGAIPASGTPVLITDIPEDAVELMLVGYNLSPDMSGTSTSQLVLRLGDANGIRTSGYSGSNYRTELYISDGLQETATSPISVHLIRAPYNMWHLVPGQDSSPVMSNGITQMQIFWKPATTFDAVGYFYLGWKK